ncbi:HtaA domain-containing protein [Streptomyces sp. NPDC002187]|uniref:HtaA domain-containing protein n=1 Tax=Streptomyces sp. NPDC002187 TaxID=3364637 RepID=UPI00368AFB2A
MSASRRPLTLAAAIATAVALGATGFALPALAAGSAPEAPGAPRLELKDGVLEWGFKESFRTYVTGMAQGTIEVADGAKQAADNGPFSFTDGKGTHDTGTGSVDTAFKGSVRFTAPVHGFTITIADVKVVTAGKDGSIQADVTLNGATQDDIAVASLDLANVRPGQGDGGATVFKNIPAKLTADGAKAFNGMYKEGDALDPATLSVKTATGPAPTTSVSPSPSGTTSPSPSAPPTSAAPSATSPTPSATSPAPSAEIVDGNLDWGVKKSFRTYVTGPIAGGRIEVTGGAAALGDGYRFPEGKGTFDATGKSLDASFDGGVRFLGHRDGDEYLLDLTLSGLELEAEGARGTLVADVSTKDRATKKVSTYENLEIASLTLPAKGLVAEDGVVKLAGVPAKLTADGVKAFGNMYPAGEQLDALTVAVSLDEDQQLPPATGGTDGGTSGGTSSGGAGTAGGSVGGTSGGGSLATTGSGVPAGALLAACAGIVAAGAGVVAAVRRREPLRP